MTPTKPQITPMTCSTWFDPIRWLQDLRGLRQLTGVPFVSFGRVCTSSHFCKRGGKFFKKKIELFVWLCKCSFWEVGSLKVKFSNCLSVWLQMKCVCVGRWRVGPNLFSWACVAIPVKYSFLAKLWTVISDSFIPAGEALHGGFPPWWHLFSSPSLTFLMLDWLADKIRGGHGFTL